MGKWSVTGDPSPSHRPVLCKHVGLGLGTHKLRRNSPPETSHSGLKEKQGRAEEPWIRGLECQAKALFLMVKQDSMGNPSPCLPIKCQCPFLMPVLCPRSSVQ